MVGVIAGIVASIAAFVTFASLNRHYLPKDAFTKWPDAGIMGFQENYPLGRIVRMLPGVGNTPFAAGLSLGLIFAGGFAGLDLVFPYGKSSTVWAYAFGGATIRLPRDAGWGNAMRWLLTGEEYDAAEAYRLGLVQEVVEPGRQLDRAIELATAIADKSAPLGVKTTLASAHQARLEGEATAFARLDADMAELFETEDGREGLRSFVERREARFVGR